MGPPRDRVLGRARLRTESWEWPTSGQRSGESWDRPASGVQGGARLGTQSSDRPTSGLRTGPPREEKSLHVARDLVQGRLVLYGGPRRDPRRARPSTPRTQSRGGPFPGLIPEAGSSRVAPCWDLRHCGDLRRDGRRGVGRPLRGVLRSDDLDTHGRILHGALRCKTN